MASIIKVYAPNGYALGVVSAKTLRAYITSNFHVSDFGTCKFTVSTRDDKLPLVASGANYIRVIDENGQLPDWWGIIDTKNQRVWKNGMVEINAFSLEKVLEWRTIYAMQIGGTPGEALREIIRRCNNQYGDLSIPFYAGEIYEGTFESNVTTEVNVNEVIKRVSKWAGGVGGPVCDYSATGKEDATGRMGLYVNFYNQRRGVKTGIVLNERNMQGDDELLIEQDEIWNYVIRYAPASAATDRIRVEALDAQSIADYGLRVQVAQGMGTDKDGLQYQAQKFLAQYKQPHRAIPAKLINENGLYSFVDLGNEFIHSLHLPAAAGGTTTFSDNVKILGFEVDDAAGTVAANLEVLSA
jgi:hypothetical protein